MKVHKAGLEKVVASPLGGQMPIDPRFLPTPDGGKTGSPRWLRLRTRANWRK